MTLAAALALLFCVSAGAEDSADAFEEAYGEFVGSLPRDVTDRMPDGLLSEDAESVGRAVAETVDFGWLMGQIGEALSARMGEALSLAARLTALLALSALLSSVRGGLGSEAAGRAAELCSSAVMAGVLVSLTYDAVRVAVDFLDRLSVLVGAMVPMMGALLATGGNVSTAVTAGGGMAVFLGIVEHLCAKTLPPVVGACVALSVSGAVFGGANLRGVSNLIKRVYTFFLGAVMLALTFSLSVQTSLSAGADGLAMRSARMLAGRAIPVVGGSVGDTLRTVAGSVGYLKATVGGVGLAALALVLVPPLVYIVLYRLVLIAAHAAADLLGCTAEGKLLDAMVTVFGYILAVMCICAVTVIFLVTLFVKCGVAMG